MRAGRDKDDVYTHGHSTAVVSQHSSRTAEECAAFLFPFITGKERLLDCGCGPGSISCDLAERVDHVTALDREAKIVESAKALAVERGVSNVEIVVGDVYDLDFPDDFFDVAFANQVLQHLSDPVAALREMGRVVKPGGVVAVRDADYASMLGHPGSALAKASAPGFGDGTTSTTPWPGGTTPSRTPGDIWCLGPGRRASDSTRSGSRPR